MSSASEPSEDDESSDEELVLSRTGSPGLEGLHIKDPLSWFSVFLELLPNETWFSQRSLAPQVTGRQP